MEGYDENDTDVTEKDDKTGEDDDENDSDPHNDEILKGWGENDTARY